MKKKLNIIIIGISALAILIAIFLIDGLDNILVSLRQAEPIYLLAALICVFFYWLFDSYSLKSLISTYGYQLKFFDYFKITMTGQLFSALTPFSSGGQPLQVYQMNQMGIPVGVSSSVILSFLNIYHLVRILLTGILLAINYHFFLGSVNQFRFLIIIGIVMNFAIGLMIISFIIFPNTTRKLLFGFIHFLQRRKLIKNSEKLESKIKNEIDSFYESFQLLISKGSRNILKAALFASLMLIAHYTVPFLIFQSLGFSANFLVVLAGTFFVHIISSVVPLPGGSGGAEAMFYMIFTPIYPHCDSIGFASLIWRIITYYSSILFGNIFTIDFRESAPPEFQLYRAKRKKRKRK